MRRVEIYPNRYADSVSLMRISEQVVKLDGIAAAEVQMATPANVEALLEMGFDMPSTATPNDLVVAVKGGAAALNAAVALALELLERGGGGGGEHYASLEEVAAAGAHFDLAQISLPGEYAAQQARQALKQGMEVFIFSDNVPLEQERELKQLGEEKGLLVMGPDCGVGFMHGVCLGAGSIMRPGPVGIVGASGSGAQEVGCIIEKCGSGVSSIIGTGGRDLTPAIGGLSMLMGLRRLEQDPDTRVITLVSKLADRAVMEKVLNRAGRSEKPVVAVFLGADEALFEGHRVHAAHSLEAAALESVRLATGKAPAFGLEHDALGALTAECLAGLGPQQRYFRGLYCGGTFTEEALVYFSRHNPGIRLHSNLENPYAEKLADPQRSEGHTILDLGAEDFTAAAPHPVFDPEIRLARFHSEAADPQVAVVLLDFITGPGVHEDPISPFAQACKQVAAERPIVFIAAVCGTAQDPQRVAEKEALLREAGVVVAGSNYQSARLASALMAALEERGA